MSSNIELPEDTEALILKNAGRLQGLVNRGYGLDPLRVIARQMDVFVDLFLTPEERVEFVHACEEAMEDLLDTAEQGADKIDEQKRQAEMNARLGTQAAGKLVIPAGVKL